MTQSSIALPPVSHIADNVYVGGITAFVRPPVRLDWIVVCAKELVALGDTQKISDTAKVIDLPLDDGAKIELGLIRPVIERLARRPTEEAILFMCAAGVNRSCLAAGMLLHARGHQDVVALLDRGRAPEVVLTNQAFRAYLAGLS